MNCALWVPRSERSQGRESRNPKLKFFYAGEDDSVDKVDLPALKLARGVEAGSVSGAPTRLPYLAFPAPTPFFLVSSLKPFFECKLLSIVAWFLPLPALSSPASPTPQTGALFSRVSTPCPPSLTGRATRPTGNRWWALEAIAELIFHFVQWLRYIDTVAITAALCICQHALCNLYVYTLDSHASCTTKSPFRAPLNNSLRCRLKYQDISS